MPIYIANHRAGSSLNLVSLAAIRKVYHCGVISSHVYGSFKRSCYSLEHLPCGDKSYAVRYRLG